MSRHKFDDGDGIGEKRPQTLHDKTFQIGRRNVLAGGLAFSFFASCPGDKAARHIVPISNALLDRVGRRHGLPVRIEEHAG